MRPFMHDDSETHSAQTFETLNKDSLELSILSSRVGLFRMWHAALPGLSLQPLALPPLTSHREGRPAVLFTSSELAVGSQRGAHDSSNFVALVTANSPHQVSIDTSSAHIPDKPSRGLGLKESGLLHDGNIVSAKVIMISCLRKVFPRFCRPSRGFHISYSITLLVSITPPCELSLT